MRKNGFAVTLDWLISQGFSPTIVSRFWAKVDKTSSPNGCWLWMAFTKKPGHGTIHMGGRNTGHIHAHRLSWILHFGPIPNGLYALHDCPGGDNAACVNPAHLWLGSLGENATDMVGKGRSSFGEKHWKHKLTWEQVAEIRFRYSNGGITIKVLAERYGVGKSAIFRCIHYLSWNHGERRVHCTESVAM